MIGLAVAWRLAGRGRSVLVLERDAAGAPPSAASHAAAGMLAPAAEIGFEEVELYRLGRESLRRWPAFALELEAASGIAVGYRDEGTLAVAADRDDRAALRRLFEFQREHGAPVEWLATAEALEVEPFLSPKIAAAVLSPEDHQVDNRAVLPALRAALRRSSHAELRHESEVAAVEPDGKRPAVRLAGGERIETRVIVLAAGVGAREIGELPAPLPIRPVKGQALALRAEPPFDLRHVVRGPDAYLVPKPDGRLVVGATSEEMGHDRRVTAGGLYRLLEGAVEVVPGVEELEVIETWAGLRPASRDHRPILGFLPDAPGVAVAAGHYRHGFLLAPVTADEVAAEVDAWLRDGGDGGDSARETSPLLAPFSPTRSAAAR